MTNSIYDRILSVITAITVLIVLFSTNVGLSLWFIGGSLAETFAFFYIAGLLYIVFKPLSVQAHRLVGAVGTLFWTSRGIAFIDFIYQSRLLESGIRWDLLGAVAERFLMVFLVGVMWHIRSLERIAFADAINNQPSIVGENARHSDY